MAEIWVYFKANGVQLLKLTQLTSLVKLVPGYIYGRSIKHIVECSTPVPLSNETRGLQR